MLLIRGFVQDAHSDEKHKKVSNIKEKKLGFINNNVPVKYKL